MMTDTNDLVQQFRMPSFEELRFTAESLRNPLYFIEEVLGINTLTDDQKRIVKSVWMHKYTAVQASYDVGKTFIAACISLAYLVPNPGTTIITTAPTKDQVENLLWKEISQLVANSKMPIYDERLGGRLNQTEFTLGEKWFAVGISVQVGKEEQSAVKISGYHNPQILDIIDEASGVHSAIWKAMKGHMASDNSRMLAISNPRTNNCEFKVFCDDVKTNTIHINALQHPNIVNKRNVIPGAISLDWVQEMVDKHCDEVKMHNEEDRTFEWDGKIYKPDNEAIWELCGHFPKLTDELMFGMLLQKIHGFDAMPDTPMRSLGAIDYGNWAMAYVGKQDNRGRIWTDKEWCDNDANKSLTDKAISFRNWCKANNVRDMVFVGDSDMFAMPAKAYNEKNRKNRVIDTFRKECEGLNLTFVPVIKGKTEKVDYRIYCNTVLRNGFSYKKNDEGLWIREPKLRVSKDCTWFWKSVPKLKRSLLIEGDFDQDGTDSDGRVIPDHPVDAYKICVTSFSEPIDQLMKRAALDEMRKMAVEMMG